MPIKIRMAVLASIVLGGTAAQWQEYPARYINILSNYFPAGGIGIATRIIAAELQKRISQSTVAENKPGAVGAAIVANSKPDAYGIFVTPNPAIAMLPRIMKVGHDPLQDFIAIVEVARHSDHNVTVGDVGGGHQRSIC